MNYISGFLLQLDGGVKGLRTVMNIDMIYIPFAAIYCEIVCDSVANFLLGIRL